MPLMTAPIMYAVDFYDMIDGWIHIYEDDKSYLFEAKDLEKAKKLCDEKNAALSEQNKKAGEHWAVWNSYNNLVYKTLPRVLPGIKPAMPRIIESPPKIMIRDKTETRTSIETIGDLRRYLSTIADSVPILTTVQPKGEKFGAIIVHRKMNNPDPKLDPIEIIILSPPVSL